MTQPKKLSAIIISGILIVSFSMACSSSKENQNQTKYTDYVDPFIGTGGHGHVFLGANVPFGMVQLGPSQTVQGWDWCSGYHYSDTTLLGFSHVHLSGTGIGDLGDILFFPALNDTVKGATFSHKNETARPGYYKVVLDDSGIEAELTATNRTGLHRYTFPENTDTAYITVNLKYGIGWDSAKETGIQVINDSTISGYRFSKGWADNHKVFFTAQFSQPFSVISDTTNFMKLAFVPSGNPIEAKVGISPVSVENAKLNLEAEASDISFDRAVELADNLWNEQLAKIEIQTPDDVEKTKFYTALYHTMFAPATYNDVNGDYRGADGKVYNTNNEFTNYTIFSLWDTYRAAHPLSTIINPQMQADYANTFLNIYRQQGKLPVWHLHGNETNCMVGNPGVIVMGDLVMKGFVKDTLGAYEAMKNSVMLDERSLDALKEYGFIPYDSEDGVESVAKGLEYAIADNAVAKVASLTGNNEDAQYFDKRAKSYKLYFDPATGFMRGLSKEGKFRDEDYNPFFTTHRADDYCEGNGWQYVWLVPQDPHGLIELFGSEEAFTTKLDSLFVVEGSLGEDASPDISGLVGQYAHGNEPGHHTVYLYNYVGQPYKSAPLLRHIMNDLYTDQPDGLSGNEDVGQMSAWFVLSSMGLYQVDPTGGPYLFGTPLFESSSIDLGNGKKFNIIAHDNSADNIYVQNVKLNGKPYDKSYIDYDRIMEGGTLEFFMGDSPSDTYGVSSDARP